jgi:hypothetical protein
MFQPEDDVDNDTFDNLSYREMQQMCKERGLNARGRRDVLVNRLRESFAGDVSEAIQEEEGDSNSLSSINDREVATSAGDTASVRGGSLVLCYWTEEIDFLPSESDEPSFLVHSVETSVLSSDESSVLQTDEPSVLPSNGPKNLTPGRAMYIDISRAYSPYFGRVKRLTIK